MISIRRLNSASSTFNAELDALLAFESAQDPAIDIIVADILDDVKKRGDPALLEYTRRFDRVHATSVAQLEFTRAEMDAALETLPTAQRSALEQAASRVRSYHERQVAKSWSYIEDDGTQLGQHVTPLDRVGVYVPGGKASYPSSVLMNALPAKVAGVRELVMVTRRPSPLVLASAALAGVDRAIGIGGAHALGALSYGPASLPRFDK